MKKSIALICAVMTPSVATLNSHDKAIMPERTPMQWYIPKNKPIQSAKASLERLVSCLCTKNGTQFDTPTIQALPEIRLSKGTVNDKDTNGMLDTIFPEANQRDSVKQWVKTPITTDKNTHAMYEKMAKINDYMTKIKVYEKTIWCLLGWSPNMDLADHTAITTTMQELSGPNTNNMRTITNHAIPEINRLKDPNTRYVPHQIFSKTYCLLIQESNGKQQPIANNGEGVDLDKRL